MPDMTDQIAHYRAQIARILEEYWQKFGNKPYTLTLGMWRMHVSRIDHPAPEEHKP